MEEGTETGPIAPVLSWEECYGDVVEQTVLPPIHLLHMGDATSGEPGLQSQRNEPLELRSKFFTQLHNLSGNRPLDVVTERCVSHGVVIEMIVMIVADDDEIEMDEIGIIDAKGRRHHTLQQRRLFGAPVLR